tara:strand:- start:201 stop:911 length:711 start_codon:yes stop_codon:yes gene_type:complete
MDMRKTYLKWLKIKTALQRLLKNPKDLEAVFIVLKWLSGRSMTKQYNKFKVSEIGKRIITEQNSLGAVLDNVTTLKNMPLDSLGEEYSKFLIATNKSSKQFAKDSKGQGEEVKDSDYKFFIKRARDQHDIHHTVAGYERNPFGEMVLLAFLHGNFTNLGMFALVVTMTIAQIKVKGWIVLPIVIEAFLNGRKADWFFGAGWETLLGQPLAEVRVDMQVREAVKYKAFMQKLRNKRI